MKWLIRILLLLTLYTTTSVVSATSNSGIDSQLLDNNLQVVLTQRKGLSDIVDYLGSNRELFNDQTTADNQLPDRIQRQQIRSTWVSLLDRLLVLDSISQSYEDYKQQDEITRNRAFRIAYAAFLARYRYVLDFLQITESNPQAHILLNERVADLGLESGTYSKIKFHYLNIAIATEFARLSLSYRLIGEQSGFPLNQGIKEDQAKLWEYGKGKGIQQTVKNGVQIIKDSSFKAFFPVQKGVSEWMGDVRVHRPHQSLITQQQIRTLLPRLEPGDVLLERREWYLSNIGLPGFWPHAALHIGTPEQRKHYFDDEQVREWLMQQGIDNGELDSLLIQRYPKAYTKSLSPDQENHSMRIIEAISEGVVFTSLEHSAAADSLAILRPKLTKLAKAKAILQAFHYIGRAYDFNFDFLTDSELVCTELVYKAYEAGQEKAGLNLPVVEIMGRLATPANQIVKQFDEQFGSAEQQFELVLFLDGHEKSRTATESDVAGFRQSWKRPKWHIFIQNPDG
ncbi:MAG: hypothetical protein JAY82_17420 [Candidatus Thiodiazotropha taylori]|nr:hypothetical protein [Candidatus Thiodiazotropha taylori]